MIELNYGKHAIPNTLQQIIDLQTELHQTGLTNYGYLLGYYFAIEGLDSRSYNTPLDMIIFSMLGAASIHFGFLTEFGEVLDLETAYIVRVSPMDFEDPMKIVARNLHDFLRIMCFHPTALEVVDTHTTKEDYLTYAKRSPELFGIQFPGRDDQQVREIVQKTFQLTPLSSSLWDYMQCLRNDREKQIVLPTDDHIGIVSPTLHFHKEQHQLWKLDSEQTLELGEVQNFFENASFGAKLVFLREAQSKGLLFENYTIQEYVKEQLRKLHLYDEAERIFYC